MTSKEKSVALQRTIDEWARPATIETLVLLCREYAYPDLPQLVEHLMWQEAVDPKDERGAQAFLYVCGSYSDENLIEIVCLFVEQGVDFNYVNADGCNVLHVLCRCYSEKNLYGILEYLFQHGASATVKDARGTTPLMLLCAYYDKDNINDIIRLIIDNGADVNSVNDYGDTAFRLAKGRRHSEAAGYIDFSLIDSQSKKRR